jgi:aldehyde dehydrogenase
MGPLDIAGPWPVLHRAASSANSPNREDVEKALDAAHAVKDHWGRTSPAERAANLAGMQENLQVLALAETLDNGKPIRETRNADVPLAIDHFRYFAAASAPRKGGQRVGRTTPSPITSRSPWAWSGRSFPGTSRC